MMNLVLRTSRHSANMLQKMSARILTQASKTFCTQGTYDFETLAVRIPSKHVISVEINRPETKNSMNKEFWREFLACFREIQDDTKCRAVIVSGSGNFFSAGLDFTDMKELTSHIMSDMDIARKAKFLQSGIASFQETFSAIEKCNKPVIAAVHGGCIGAGVDLITACDIRYCTQDAWFAVKEVEMGIAADVGTLQRLPKIVGNSSLVRELVFTARKLEADEAKQLGLVSKIFPTPEALYEAALETAKIIATKSPVAVQGSKVNLNYSRDHTVAEGLKFMTYWNMTMMQSEDIIKAATALMTKSKDPPQFSKL